MTPHDRSDAAAASPTSRLAAVRPALALAALCILFAVLAAVNLDDVRPVSGDDAMITSVSARLADAGVLGSRVHDGILGAGSHYFMNLPLQHVLQAAVFRIVGEGVAQARIVSVVAAVALLCASTLIAARWFGTRVAVATALLLTFWRSGLVGLDYGLPLLAVGRSARYDITAVALLWLAILAFDTNLRRPRRGTALLTGGLAAAATLTQFHGALVLPALLALWFAQRRSVPTRELHAPWIGAGFVLGIAPYATFFAVHIADAIDQIRLVHASRIVDGPGSLLWNIVTEPLRFGAAASQRGIGQVGLLVAIAAAPVLALRPGSERRDRTDTTNGTRRLLAVGVALLLPLALLERTKAALYALPLLPVFCMLLAVALDGMWRRASHAGRRAPALRIAVLLVVGALFAEGTATIVRDQVAAQRVTSYDDVAATIASNLERGATVAGPAQWSWGLRSHTYVDLGAVALRIRASQLRGEIAPAVEVLLRTRGVRYIVINDDLRSELQRDYHGSELSNAIADILDRCTTSLRAWTDRTYGALEVRTLSTVCPQ